MTRQQFPIPDHRGYSCKWLAACCFLAVTASLTPAVDAAERVVLCEEFTSVT